MRIANVAGRATIVDGDRAIDIAVANGHFQRAVRIAGGAVFAAPFAVPDIVICRADRCRSDQDRQQAGAGRQQRGSGAMTECKPAAHGPASFD